LHCSVIAAAIAALPDPAAHLLDAFIRSAYVVVVTDRLTLTVLVYLHPGCAAAFAEYERSAFRVAATHGGRLEQRIVCPPSATGPDEIHVVSFPDAASFDRYRSDERLEALAASRAAAIRATTILAGYKAESFVDTSSAEPLRIVGMDHVYLAVADLARSEAFYDAVMGACGFRKGDKPIAGERHAHYFNPSLQISIRQARSASPHDPYSPGLHHLCLQAADRPGVDVAYERFTALDIEATVPRVYPEYNPDYYATFFEDPDGIRLEVVARSPYRETIARRWSEFRVFLNPLAELSSRT
jgi:glyoxylase I family protein